MPANDVITVLGDGSHGGGVAHAGTGPFREDIEAEKGSDLSHSPAAHLPFDAEVTNIRMFGQVEQPRIHPTIVFGWEQHKGAYAPVACVGRSPDGDGERLLLYNPINAQGNYEKFAMIDSKIDVRTDTVGAGDVLRE